MQMADDQNEGFWNMRFSDVKVGEQDCKISRMVEDLTLLYDFNDISPQYSEEHGAHLKIYKKNSREFKIVPLKEPVLRNMCITGAKDMEHKEYLKAFVEKKKAIVDMMIQRTFQKGFTTPHDVQSIAIPELIQCNDVLIQFKSGTGKTHAFLLGLLWGFDPSDDVLQYIFITSSHEVATQIHEHATELCPNGTRIVLCIGRKKEPNQKSGGFRSVGGFTRNTSSLHTREKTIQEENTEIKRAHILICTMGKLYDCMCNRKDLINPKYLKAMCVDEFDNIVASRSRPKNSTTFSTEEQMMAMMKKIPEDTQRVFFSATVTDPSLQITYSYFRTRKEKEQPFALLLHENDYTLEGIKQYYVEVTSIQEKKDVIKDLLEQLRIAQCVIFTNHIETAYEIKDWLAKLKIPQISAIIHGELTAAAREAINLDFKENKIRVLIATDVIARGYDVQSINVVILFDMPDTIPIYIHRVGRSGRYGRKGVAISLVLVNNRYDERKKIASIDEVSQYNKMQPLPSELATLL